MPKIIATVSTVKIPSSAGSRRTRRKPSRIERRLGDSASWIRGRRGRSQIETSEATNVARSNAYAPA